MMGAALTPNLKDPCRDRRTNRFVGAVAPGCLSLQGFTHKLTFPGLGPILIISG